MPPLLQTTTTTMTTTKAKTGSTSSCVRETLCTHQRLCVKILDEGGDHYCVIFLGKHSWVACREWFSDDKILNQWNDSHGCRIKNNHHFTSERDYFLLKFDAGTTFLSGKHPTPINDSEQGTLLHIGHYLKKEEQIDELLENAEDLLLKKDWLESI